MAINFSRQPILWSQDEYTTTNVWFSFSYDLARHIHRRGSDCVVAPEALLAFPVELLDSIIVIARSIISPSTCSISHLKNLWENNQSVGKRIGIVAYGTLLEIAALIVTPIMVALQIIVQVGHILRSFLVTGIGFFAPSSKAFEVIAELKGPKHSSPTTSTQPPINPPEAQDTVPQSPAPSKNPKTLTRSPTQIYVTNDKISSMKKWGKRLLHGWEYGGVGTAEADAFGKTRTGIFSFIIKADLGEIDTYLKLNDIPIYSFETNTSLKKCHDTYLSELQNIYNHRYFEHLFTFIVEEIKAYSLQKSDESSVILSQAQQSLNHILTLSGYDHTDTKWWPLLQLELCAEQNVRNSQTID